MAKIINLTPHALSFYAAEAVVETRKGPYTAYTVAEGAEPALVIGSSGVARASAAEEVLGAISTPAGEFPEVRMTLGAPEGLPEEVGEDDIIVVSLITAQAAAAHGYAHYAHLRVVARTVRDSANQICGCCAFARP